LHHQLNFPSAVPELAGDQVRLRELGESDIPTWYARATDAESADLAGDPIPTSMDEGRVWLQRHQSRFRAGVTIRWAIVLPAQNESIGTVGLAVTSREHRVGEIGIVVGRSHWSKGFGTAAARLALSYGLSELGLQEVQAEVLQRNLASVHLLEKLNFRRVRSVPASESPDGEALFHYSLRAVAASAA
jgi:ribosomal-protein-alanine N-acetyltransferase